MNEKSGHAVLASALAQLAALADDAHITRAADRTRISQPTLSRAIRRWERDLAIPLLVPDGRGVQLTPQALELAATAGEAMQLLDAAVNRLRGRDSVASLHLGLLTSLGPTVVGELVSSFLADQPGVAIAHREAPSTALLRGLDDGTLDLVVMAPRPSPPYEWLHVGWQALSLVVPAGHQFAGRRLIHLADTADERYLALDRRFDSRRCADRLCAAAGFTPRIVLEADDVRSVRNYVGSGLGIAVLPADTTTDPRTTSIPIDSADAVREFGLVWRPDADNAAIRALIAHTTRLGSRYPGWADISS
jgi:DNA-binding transcriptional LysR family regulator